MHQSIKTLAPQPPGHWPGVKINTANFPVPGGK